MNQTKTTSQPAELLAQLGDLIQASETYKYAAEQWRALLGLCRELGYGPGIDPATIASLLPNAHVIAEIVAATLSAPAPAAEIVTVAAMPEIPPVVVVPVAGGNGQRPARGRSAAGTHNRQQIRELHAQGLKARAIAERTGLTLDNVYYHLQALRNEQGGQPPAAVAPFRSDGGNGAGP